MQLVKEKLSNGNEVSYKIFNGTAYHEETPQEVINILNDAMNNRKRIRIFYGDTKTGLDWHEEYDTIGYIGKSTGNIKIPLLIKNNRSYGGGALLDQCIVKITIDKRIVYQHKNYNLGELAYKNINSSSLPFAVLCDNKNIANFETEDRAKKYIAFLKGERNSK